MLGPRHPCSAVCVCALSLLCSPWSVVHAPHRGPCSWLSVLPTVRASHHLCFSTVCVHALGRLCSLHCPCSQLSMLPPHHGPCSLSSMLPAVCAPCCSCFPSFVICASWLSVVRGLHHASLLLSACPPSCSPPSCSPLLTCAAAAAVVAPRCLCEPTLVHALSVLWYL